jgi:hypothetical protein
MHQFSENNFRRYKEKIKYSNVDVKLASAQISLQLSYVLVENILSIEFGIVQVNGKFKSDEEENNTIKEPFVVKDIIDISKFNFYPAVGITAG